MLGFLFSGFLLYAPEYDIEDVRYCFIPTYLVLALFATSGLGALLRRTEALTRGDPEIRKAASPVSPVSRCRCGISGRPTGRWIAARTTRGGRPSSSWRARSRRTGS